MSAQPASSTSMPAFEATKKQIVRIMRPDGQGGEKFVMELPRHIATHYCRSIYVFLSSDPKKGYVGPYARAKDESLRVIHIPQGSPDAYKLISGSIEAGPRAIPAPSRSGRNNTAQPPARDIFIDVATLSTEKAVAVWEVCEILGLQNTEAQNRLGSKLNWDVSHTKITSELFKSVMKVFARFRDHAEQDKKKVYHTTIHQLSWAYVHGTYNAEEKVRIKQAVDEVGGQAKEDVEAKVKVLGEKLAEHEAHQRANQANRQRREWERRMVRECQEIKQGLRRWTPAHGSFMADRKW